MWLVDLTVQSKVIGLPDASTLNSLPCSCHEVRAESAPHSASGRHSVQPIAFFSIKHGFVCEFFPHFMTRPSKIIESTKTRSKFSENIFAVHIIPSDVPWESNFYCRSCSLCPHAFHLCRKCEFAVSLITYDTMYGHGTGVSMKRAARCRGGGDTEYKIMQMKNMNLMRSEPGKGWMFTSCYFFLISHSSAARKTYRTRTNDNNACPICTNVDVLASGWTAVQCLHTRVVYAVFS